MVSEYETTLPNASVPVINQDRRLWLEALADFHGEGIVPRENISIRTLIAPSPEHKKWLDQRYLFISTPSHGYVKVHSSVLGMIGILDEFSAYSPTHGGYRFLEEDCDAYKFICALADALGKTRHDVMEENLDYVEQQELP